MSQDLGEQPATGSLAGGAAWMVAARMAERLLGLGSTVVLARLLAPSDFGLVAMAMVFVAAADLLGAFGLDWALVRQPGLERRHLDTAWTFRSLLGLGSLAALALLAVPAAHFYREPRIAPMVLVLGASLLVGALENPGVIMFRREMNFRAEFRLRTAAKVAGAVVAVAVAVLYRSYWALLLGAVTARTVATAMSYVVHPYRPRPTLSARQELLGFSFWLWLANILTFVRTRIVELILGRTVGPRALGLFSVANELAQLASTELAAPINRALFSSYATKADRHEAVGAAYVEAAPVIWLMTLPVVVGTFLVAPQVVWLILGVQWQEAVPLLRVLSLAGVLGLFTTGAVHVYWSINRSRLETGIEMCAVACLLTFVLVLTPRMGVIGAAVAVLISNAVLIPLNVGLMRRYAGVSVRQLIARSWRTVAACSAMSAVLWSIASGWTPASSLDALGQLATLAGLGAAVYAVVLFGLWRLTGSKAGPESALLRLAADRIGALRARSA